MPELLGLKSGKQPALANIHQAHQQVEMDRECLPNTWIFGNSF